MLCNIYRKTNILETDCEIFMEDNCEMLSIVLWTHRELNPELTHAKGTVYRLPTGPG